MNYIKIFLYAIVIIVFSFLFFTRSVASSTTLVVAPIATSTEPVATTTVISHFVGTRTFENIAKCESKNDPHAKNKYSSASGRFQFLWGTWNYYGKKHWGKDFYEKNIFNYDDNTELAWWVYQTYGTGDWDASSACWE